MNPNSLNVPLPCLHFLQLRPPSRPFRPFRPSFSPCRPPFRPSRPLKPSWAPFNPSLPLRACKPSRTSRTKMKQEKHCFMWCFIVNIDQKQCLKYVDKHNNMFPMQQYKSIGLPHYKQNFNICMFVILPSETILWFGIESVKVLGVKALLLIFRLLGYFGTLPNFILS